jgi:hypothetical protein
VSGAAPEAAAPGRATRTSVMLSAHVFRAGQTASTRHRALNLSSSGLCIAQPDGLAPGDRLLVTLGQVDHAVAVVVWIRGGLAGLRFDAPIDVAAARLRRADCVVAAPVAGWLAALPDPYRAGRRTG